MSEKLINLSPDLRRLRDEGLQVEVKNGYLLIHAVPYVTPSGKIAFGTVVTDLSLNGDKTRTPDNHQIWFTGETPCHKTGSVLQAISPIANTQTLASDIIVNFRFSCKPKEGYPDHYEKMTSYIEILQNPAKSIDPSVTAYTFRPDHSNEDESVFLYTDTASSRYGLAGLSEKCAMNKVAIVGLGGTGSYILDLIAKTHIEEIHLIDGDQFAQHNAFRAPGAASLAILERSPSKVEYYAGIYSHMRRGIVPHEVFLDDTNIGLLADFDFVFMNVDKPAVRKLAFGFLNESSIPFIDSGMELEYIEEQRCLIGDCRATLCTPLKSDHLSKRVSVRDAVADDIYDANIQVVEMNALNATLAVIKWKKFCGYYQDLYQEHHTTYSLNTHQLARDELVEKENK